MAFFLPAEAKAAKARVIESVRQTEVLEPIHDTDQGNKKRTRDDTSSFGAVQLGYGQRKDIMYFGCRRTGHFNFHCRFVKRASKDTFNYS